MLGRLMKYQSVKEEKSVEDAYPEAPSTGLCLRPRSPAFALVLDLIVVLPRPLLFCGGIELSKVVEEFVVLAVTLGAEAMSCRMGAGKVAQEARGS